MHPRLRTALVVTAAILAAVYFGVQLAEGSIGLAALAAVTIIAAILVRLIGLPLDTIMVGFLLIGYVVGNRGFAQLMPLRGVPLLPAEIGLLVAVSWRGILCAFERRLPFRNNALNWAVLAWLVAGSARVIFDIPHYRLLALRDFAMVYYAAFFFLAQHMAGDERARRYLQGCFLGAVLALIPMFALFQLFPQFFTTKLTYDGVPLIYYKGDLAVTFLGFGSIWLFNWTAERRHLWAVPLSAVLVLYVLAGDNRASLLGLLTAAGLLFVAGRRAFPLMVGALGAAGFIGLLALALVVGNPWAEQKLDGVSERVRSIVDVTGTGRYESQESFAKGDNNRFRLIWWKNVVVETWETNPVLGLGFGTDLAQGFLQEYYPDSNEDFNVRSPHNIIITTFGRMGFVGLAVWLAFCAILFWQTWRALRYLPEPGVWSLWCTACVVLVSGTFGVVLEGPMGAVIFWTALGLASAQSSPPRLAPLPAAAPAETESVSAGGVDL